MTREQALLSFTGQIPSRIGRKVCRKMAPSTDRGFCDHSLAAAQCVGAKPGGFSQGL